MADCSARFWCERERHAPEAHANGPTETPMPWHGAKIAHLASHLKRSGLPGGSTRVGSDRRSVRRSSWVDLDERTENGNSDESGKKKNHGIFSGTAHYQKSAAQHGVPSCLFAVLS